MVTGLRVFIELEASSVTLDSCNHSLRLPLTITAMKYFSTRGGDVELSFEEVCRARTFFASSNRGH